MDTQFEVQRLIRLYGTQVADATHQRVAEQVLHALHLNGSIDLDYLLSEGGRQMIRRMVREATLEEN